MAYTTNQSSASALLHALMTRKVACGAAAALAVGIGLGVWLEPPKPHIGSQTVINPPQEQPNLWGDAPSSVSTLPYSQPETSASAMQVASLSQPAGGYGDSAASAPSGGTMQLAQADARQVAASGDTSHAAAPVARPIEATDTHVTWTQTQPQARPVQPLQPQAPVQMEQPRQQGRDWAAYDVRDRSVRYGGDARDDGDDEAPPPPRWERPPERRWDFRPDGSAVPLDGGDD